MIQKGKSLTLKWRDCLFADEVCGRGQPRGAVIYGQRHSMRRRTASRGAARPRTATSSFQPLATRSTAESGPSLARAAQDGRSRAAKSASPDRHRLPDKRGPRGVTAL